MMTFRARFKLIVSISFKRYDFEPPQSKQDKRVLRVRRLVNNCFCLDVLGRGGGRETVVHGHEEDEEDPVINDLTDHGPVPEFESGQKFDNPVNHVFLMMSWSIKT